MKATLICLLFFGLSQCNPSEEKLKYWIGHIEPDKALLSDGFETCNDTIMHLYKYRSKRSEMRAGYHGGNRAIKSYVDQRYDSHVFDATGYLTFRFVMNCRGETGNFVIEEMDLDFNEYKFPEGLKNKLLNITASMDNWRPLCFNDENKDVYIFITYKLVNGEIMEILP